MTAADRYEIVVLIIGCIIMIMFVYSAYKDSKESYKKLLESKTEQNLYGFFYCSCTFESVPALMSLHRTAEGAYKAMKIHRLKHFYRWRKMPRHYRNDFKDTFDQEWEIRKVIVND